MRILFITHYFYPEAHFLGLPFAKELARRGHEVEVLTGFPNYPGGKIFDGYKVKPLQREMIDGISVIRVPLYPSHDQSSLKRIVTYLTCSVSQATIGPWVVKPADVAYVPQGPATLGLPAWMLKTFRRIPFVYNIQDIWPDSLLSTGMFNNKAGLKLINYWCNFVYKNAAKISVISPGMKKILCERGVPEDKIEIIYNWCDDSLICRDDRDADLCRSLGMDNKFNIVFAGNIGKAQAMAAVLKAAKLLEKDCPDVQIVLIGAGVEVESLKKQKEELGLNNVLFHPRKTVSEIGPILRLADALLVHLKDDPLFRITIPSKTQAYIAIGRPVLVGVSGDAADLVMDAKAGVACQPENPGSIAEAIKKLYNMSPLEREKMGDNGIAFYERNLAFTVAVDKYEDLFSAAKR